MDLHLPTDGLERYKSASQRARVCTEPWGAANLYCPACDSPRIKTLPTNTEARDFQCPACDESFQLKSKSAPFGRTLRDGAFAAMQRTILKGEIPSLFLLQYTLPDLLVKNVLLIPNFVFTESILEKQKPLSANARRAGWVGCNFLLDRLPPDAQIDVIQNGNVVPPAEVREKYGRLRPLEKLNASKRGWTLDVLNFVRSLNKQEFTLAEVYAHEASLARLHPKNANIQPKIRQQLQVLRDLGFVTFLGSGSYRLT